MTAVVMVYNTAGREIVEKLLVAAARSDADSVLELCTPDVVYTLVDLDTYHGHDRVRSFFEFQRDLAGVHREITTVVEQGARVAVERVDTFLFPEATLTQERAAFFELRDGLVCRWTDYQDMRATGRVLGYL